MSDGLSTDSTAQRRIPRIPGLLASSVPQCQERCECDNLAFSFDRYNDRYLIHDTKDLLRGHVDDYGKSTIWNFIDDFASYKLRVKASLSGRIMIDHYIYGIPKIPNDLGPS